MMWTNDDGLVEVTSTFMGMTTPLSDLYAAIQSRGWEMGKVKWTANGYEAEAKNPETGQKVKKTGMTEDAAVAHLLVALTRLDYIRTRWSRHKAGMWQTTFTSELEAIAKAYSEAPNYDPKAAAAWVELAQDSTRRADVLRQQLHIEVVDDPEPYATPQEMCEDVRKNKHFLVSRANSNHPIWSAQQNVDFRIVHDVLGHCVSGGDFGWQGENLACGAHFALLSPTAQKALFTECIGQTAYTVFYRAFHPTQKVVFLDDVFTDEHQSKENGINPQPVHPSQSLAPVETPQMPPSIDPNAASPFPQGWGFQPHVEQTINQQAVFAHFRRTGGLDPNQGWSSDIPPLERGTEEESGAAATHWGDPLGVHTENDEGLTHTDIVRRLDTGWASFVNPDGTPNRPLMKKAIVNAFSTVLLSPRKDLRWNAIHYQHLHDLVHLSTDPNEYHRKLEAERVAWNAARKIPINAHKPYYQAEREYAKYLKARNPAWSHDECVRRAEEFVRKLLEDEKRKVAAELEVKEANKPEEKRTTTSQIEIKAAGIVTKLIEEIIAPKYNPDTDFGPQEAFKFGAAQLHPPGQMGLQADEVDPTVTDLFNGKTNPEDMGAYGAWMGDHLKAIAAVSHRADEILDAALKDVHEHDGAGHHFRAYVLSMSLPNVGPKVTSFAWLLLQPMTSQLATIDTHMMDVLGYDYKHMSNRDYFKYERELAARRDAAGYQGVPLGSFQWAMWDFKRSGPGKHQDHSAMRVIDPLDHNLIDWKSKATNIKGQAWKNNSPPWWRATDPAAEQIGQHWDDTVAPHYRRDEVPYQNAPVYAPVTSASKEPANEFHVAWAIPQTLRDRIANWAASLEWPDGFELEDPDDYHITAVYAKGGWDDPKQHEWVKRYRTTGVPFKSTGLDLFGPEHEDNRAVVIRLDSDQADEQATRLMDRAETNGLEVSRYPGGYKAHLTVAYASGMPKGDPISLDFRSGDLYISKPRAQRENDDGHVLASLGDPAPAVTYEDGETDVGAPGTTIMQHLRESLGLSAEEVWASGIEGSKVGP